MSSRPFRWRSLRSHRDGHVRTAPVTSRVLTTVAILAALVVPTSTVGADEHPDASNHVRRLTTAAAPIAPRTGMVFQGSLAVAGSPDGFGIFRISSRAPFLEFVSFYMCPGSDVGDITIWGNYVFQSVEGTPWRESTLQDYDVETPVCNNTDDSMRKGGIRVVDISDVYEPRQIDFVPLPGGSPQHSLVPAKGRLYLYSHLPAGNYEQDDSSGGLPKANTQLKIIRFDPERPRRSRPISNNQALPMYGCYDITVFMARDLAACSAWASVFLLDISDPANPTVLGDGSLLGEPVAPTIVNPKANWFAAAQFTWDGKYLVLADSAESFYMTAHGGVRRCTGESDERGALWFYEVTDPARPVLRGRFSLPREEGRNCSPRQLAALPMREEGRYVVAAGWAAGGWNLVDFSDPSRPEELAYWDDPRDTQIVANWYNGRFYVPARESTPTGLYVYTVDGFGVEDVRSFDLIYNPQTQIEDADVALDLLPSGPAFGQPPRPRRVADPQTAQGSVVRDSGHDIEGNPNDYCDYRYHRDLRRVAPEELRGQVNGIYGFDFRVAPRTWGSRFRLDPTGGEGRVDLDLYFYVKIADRSAPQETGTMYWYDERTRRGERGIVPKYVNHAVVCMFRGSDATFTYRAG